MTIGLTAKEVAEHIGLPDLNDRAVRRWAGIHGIGTRKGIMLLFSPEDADRIKAIHAASRDSGTGFARMSPVQRKEAGRKGGSVAKRQSD